MSVFFQLTLQHYCLQRWSEGPNTCVLPETYQYVLWLAESPVHYTCFLLLLIIRFFYWRLAITHWALPPSTEAKDQRLEFPFPQTFQDSSFRCFCVFFYMCFRLSPSAWECRDFQKSYNMISMRELVHMYLRTWIILPAFKYPLS